MGTQQLWPTRRRFFLYQKQTQCDSFFVSNQTNPLWRIFRHGFELKRRSFFLGKWKFRTTRTQQQIRRQKPFKIEVPKSSSTNHLWRHSLYYSDHSRRSLLFRKWKRRTDGKRLRNRKFCKL